VLLVQLQVSFGVGSKHWWRYLQLFKEGVQHCTAVQQRQAAGGHSRSHMVVTS
jgi:hypothetical protein